MTAGKQHVLRQHRTLFRALAEEMRQAIRSGEWAVGKQLLAEQDLAQEYHVSRATLREAIGLLVSEGLIVKRHGIGNFVAAQRMSTGLETLQSTTGWIESSGRIPGTRQKQCIIRQAETDEREELRLEPGDDVIEVSRIRTADGEPIIYSRDRIPCRLFDDPFRAKHQFESAESLLQVLDDFGIYITAANAVVRTASDNDVRKELSDGATDVVFYLKQMHVDASSQPCMYSDIYFNGSKLELHVMRRR